MDSHDHETWADDLTYDEYSGVAIHRNQIYTKKYHDFHEMHSNFMHRNFHFYSGNDHVARSYHNEHYVYGVLTAFNFHELDLDKIKKAFNFYVTYLTTELLDKISNVPNECVSNSAEEDNYYTQTLKNSFKVTEDIFSSVQSEILCQKTVLGEYLNGLKPEIYPRIADQYNEISRELSLGFSAVVSLVYNKRLYVANIGDTRAILCKKVLNDSGEDRIVCVELTVKHNLDNNEEIRRLSHIGLDTEFLRSKGEIGNMLLTRCLGNLWLKNFYTDIDDLKLATEDPILSEPSVSSISVDDSCLFFILSSSSLIQTMQEAFDKAEVIDDLFKMILEEMQKCSDLKRVAQEVLNQICQKHYKRFYSNATNIKTHSSSYTRPPCRQVDDITLLIRNLKVNDDCTNYYFSDLNQNLCELQITVNETDQTDTCISTTDSDNTLVNSNVLFDTLDKESKKLDPDAEVDPYVDLTELLDKLDCTPQTEVTS